MRTIGVVTVSRSDYGIYLPVLRRIQDDPALRLYLIVAGMHLSPEFGLTAQAIEADSFEINERVEMLLSSDSPEGVAKSMGLGLVGFSQVYARFQPDILLVLGDRFEMFAAAAAALPFKIPLAHLHGGELSEGAIDDAIRHSITKLSQLHFVATDRYAQRVMQLGEEPWRITVCGAPGLDNLHSITLLTRKQLGQRYGLDLTEPPLLVTYHPVTLEPDKTEWQVSQLLSALEQVKRPIIFTYPNADAQGRLIIRLIKAYVAAHPKAIFVKNLGTRDYFSLMSLAAAMVGNSSSGIIEAASFKLPVVNIGNRQRGRIHDRNVINTGYDSAAILAALDRALSPEFRSSLDDLENPYGDGHAAERIVQVLKNVELNDALLTKHFYDLPSSKHEGSC